MSPAPPSRHVAVLAPMPSELAPVLRHLAGARREAGAEPVHRGTIGATAVLATTTGIGTGRAARRTEALLAREAIDHVVVVGVAGGIGPRVAVGDLVVPERVIDLGRGTEHRPARLGPAAPCGTLVTQDGLLTDPDALARLARDGAVAIDMETAAVARVCEAAGRPWSVFRAISDRADDGTVDAAVFALAGPDGRPRPAAVARFVLARPWRIPRLVLLARGLHRATRRAAAAAAEAIGSR